MLRAPEKVVVLVIEKREGETYGRAGEGLLTSVGIVPCSEASLRGLH